MNIVFWALVLVLSIVAYRVIAFVFEKIENILKNNKIKIIKKEGEDNNEK